MAQEARNTERYTSRRSNVKLRYNEIKFVSAGDMVQEKFKALDEGSADNGQKSEQPNEDPTIVDQNDVQGDCEKQLDGTVKEHQDGLQEEDEASAEPDIDPDDMFIIDSKGEDPAKQLQAVNPTTAHAALSAAELDSSEDEVVFTGRGRRLQLSSAHWSERPNTGLDAWTRALSSQDDGDDDDQNPSTSHPVSMSDNESEPAIIYTSEPVPRHHPTKVDGFISFKGPQKRSGGRKPRKPGLHWDSDDSEILADYIANMMDDDTSGEDEDEDAGLKQIQVQDRTSRLRTESWSSADLEDLNDLSSSDELPDQVGRIFSMRERGEGIQYLLIGVGQSADEARWVREELLTMPGAVECIQEFRENAELIASRQTVDSDSSTDDLDEEDEEDELDPSPDADEQEMTDEQMARLLQTQESFGLGTNDVLLFDGNAGFDDFENILGSKFPYKSSSQSKKRRNRKGNFPSASAFADALDQNPYGGFDVMDFDRPSLKKKPKGRRHAHQQDFGLSDSELEWELQTSWENDRKKKKAKKQEREELRSQGLLGTKPGKINMKAKYTEGMSIEDAKQEIRTFLGSSSQSLSLPPMDKRNRKLVHEMANMLSLKSLSRGNGTSRFPILTKTSRTPNLEGQSFHQVDRVFASGRFMRRMDRPHRSLGGAKPVAKARGGTKAASYMDGDVVGASAPEIGAGNKGRAMLEKMGWSTGTALGAVNNKGILHPVVHVVKNTKAGLG
ncbi:hypothetical protein AJ79_09070 [Helicocarpus griseus UAMH5409]|uniref:Protein SQS1 n=1 Tax=Helicocarpus griseus UAMH5409 TaxID=1447875 RepID=A0A2B7WMF3_9EURO|nr:hypothetical protein AJ79_09070 [Helicocarpus griseus UAMH5409]